MLSKTNFAYDRLDIFSSPTKMETKQFSVQNSAKHVLTVLTFICSAYLVECKVIGQSSENVLVIWYPSIFNADLTTDLLPWELNFCRALPFCKEERIQADVSEWALKTILCFKIFRQSHHVLIVSRLFTIKLSC